MSRPLSRKVWPPGMIVPRLIEDYPEVRKAYRVYITWPTRRLLHLLVAPFLPQFLHSNVVKRAYYHFSEFWWGHPSNGGHQLFSSRRSGNHWCSLQGGQRCLFCGGYTSPGVQMRERSSHSEECRNL